MLLFNYSIKKNKSESMKNIIDNILNGDIFQSCEIKTSEIPFSIEVRKACEMNHCGMYNTNWMCPPGVGEYETLRARILTYSKAYIFNMVYPLEDSFDIEGMDKARELITQLSFKVNDHLKTLNTNFITLMAGSCSVCEKCNYPDLPCRHTDKARLSMEACGIDVVSLSRTFNLGYNNGVNTVTYFSMFLYN